MLQLKREGRIRLSRKNPDCKKNPNLWHSYDQSSSEVEVVEMLVGLVRALQPELVVETGSSVGLTTRAIGEALVKNGHGRIVGIEVSSRRQRIAKRRCRGLPVEWVLDEALNWTPKETIDMLYCDSGWDSRERELDHFRPYMTLQTIIVWHDSGAQHPLLPYLQRITKEQKVSAVFLPTPRGVCIARLLI